MTDNKRRLEGVSVLILEDDYYLATDLQDTLEDAGARVLGPFACVATATDALAADRPDCALLDLNLGNGISLDLPRLLARQAIPFAFVTGYDRAAIPSSSRRTRARRSRSHSAARFSSSRTCAASGHPSRERHRTITWRAEAEVIGVELADRRECAPVPDRDLRSCPQDQPLVAQRLD